MAYVVLQIVVFLLIALALGFVAGWMMRGWGLDGSTRMSDGYEQSQREALLRELNTARSERDEARTQMLAMRASIAEKGGSEKAEAEKEGTKQKGPEEEERSGAEDGKAAQRPSYSAPPTLRQAPRQDSPSASPSATTAATEAGTDSADDLKRIKGVGPKLEQTLHEMGITSFAQIAAWTENEVREVNAKLRFQGRIERDNWIAQAQAFLAT